MKRKVPRLSEKTVFWSPPRSLVRWTITPGTAEPYGSRITPVNVPVDPVCPIARSATQRTATVECSKEIGAGYAYSSAHPLGASQNENARGRATRLMAISWDNDLQQTLRSYSRAAFFLSGWLINLLEPRSSKWRGVPVRHSGIGAFQRNRSAPGNVLPLRDATAHPQAKAALYPYRIKCSTPSELHSWAAQRTVFLVVMFCLVFSQSNSAQVKKVRRVL